MFQKNVFTCICTSLADNVVTKNKKNKYKYQNKKKGNLLKAKFKNTVRQTNIQYFLLMIFFLIKRIRQHNTSKCANYLFPACFCVPCTSCAFIVSNIQLVLDLKHFLPPPFLIIFISKIIYSNKKNLSFTGGRCIEHYMFVDYPP